MTIWLIEKHRCFNFYYIYRLSSSLMILSVISCELIVPSMKLILSCGLFCTYTFAFLKIFPDIAAYICMINKARLFKVAIFFNAFLLVVFHPSSCRSMSFGLWYSFSIYHLCSMPSIIRRWSWVFDIKYRMHSFFLFFVDVIRVKDLRFFHSSLNA